LKTTFLLGAMTGLLLALGEVFGGRDGMALALVLAGAMNFGAWFWSDKIVLRMYNAQPVGPGEAPSCTRSSRVSPGRRAFPCPSCT
jgi:heat shock protein HtpX